MVNFGKQGDCLFRELSLPFKSQTMQDISFTEFLSLNRCARTLPPLPAPLQPQPHFIHLLPSPEIRVMQSQIIHYTLATLSQVEHDRNTGKNGAKEQTLIQPMGELLHVAHTSFQHGATELCCSKGHRQKGLLSKTGSLFSAKKQFVHS